MLLEMSDRPEIATLVMTFHFLLWGVEEGGNSSGRIMSAATHSRAGFRAFRASIYGPAAVWNKFDGAQSF
jgi:hypothetical protein